MSAFNLPFNSTRRSLSPPRTSPITSRHSSSSDDSFISELSFDYTLDDEGNPVRLNKSSTSKLNNTSSPPTPQDSPPENAHPSDHSPPPPSPLQLYQTHKKPPSPTPLNSARSLLRSESEQTFLNKDAIGQSSTSESTFRSFQRVASGSQSVTTPGGANSYVNPSLSMGVKARRVTIEEHKEQDARNRLHIEEIRARIEEDMRSQEEKENLISSNSGIDEAPGTSSGLPSTSKRGSPPLASRLVPASQRAPPAFPPRATAYTEQSDVRPLSEVPFPQRDHRGRKLKNAKFGSNFSTGFNRIEEVEGSESEAGVENTGEEVDTGGEDFHLATTHPTTSTARQRTYVGLSSSLTLSGKTDPQRSASLSDASTQEDHVSSNENGMSAVPQPYARPTSSLARRVTVEEREWQDLELKQEYQRHLKETEEADRRLKALAEARAYAEAQERHDRKHRSYSPPLNTHQQPPHTHQRGESDTLRNVRNTAPLDSPPAADALPPHLSPSARNVQPFTSATARRRRSPTAPEAPIPSGHISNMGFGRAWAGDSGVGEYGTANAMGERERPIYSRGMPTYQQPISGQHRVNHHQQHLTPALEVLHPSQDSKSRSIIVNKKTYARLDVIGKGGSSRVYRVLSPTNELYAIKRVSLDKTDADTMCGYMNEIALLKRLAGNSRIIRLHDSEVRAGPGGTKGHLLLVMECGEIDLSRLLQEQQKEAMNMVWISYYWQQMLEAVHIIHEEKIVHSDLKPANFVLVRGHLKLIDFGIANAIANDTTNIQRDHQIGTVNYMSPEAIELPDGMRRLKVGRPSDIWSLGCILYQMVYGQPPFHHLSMYQKMKAIPDDTFDIDFPEFSTPSISTPKGTSPPKKLDHLKRKVRRDVIASMQSCLSRNPKERATIPDLMEQDWLAMKEPEPPSRLEDFLGRDETVINPHYMRQLLEYGIRLGRSQSSEIDSEQLLRDAERLVNELKRVSP